MITNIAVSDGMVIIKAAGTDPASIPRREFYIYMRQPLDIPGKIADEQVSEIEMDAALVHGALSAKLLPSGVILLVSPTNPRTSLQIPTSDLWPYACIVDGERINPSIDNSRPEPVFRVISVLIWGMHIDYTAEIPFIDGIYMGTCGGDTKYYPCVSLEAGISALYERAASVDVLLTNCGTMNKIDMLSKWAANNASTLRCSGVPLMTSVEEILAVDMPGLNWEFVEQVMPIGETHDRELRWKSDFIAWNPETAPARVAIMLRVVAERLISRCRTSISLGIDLRCSINANEFASAQRILEYGSGNINIITAPGPSTHIGEAISASLANRGHACTLVVRPRSDEYYYVYDAIAYAAKQRPGISRASLETGIRYGNLHSQVIANEGVNYAGMWDYGIVLGRRLDGIQPIAKLSFMAVSRRGMLAFTAEGNVYGYGALGLEGSQTQSIAIRLREQRTNTSTGRMVGSSESAYHICADPRRYNKFRFLCSSGEMAAMTTHGIPIPLILYRSRDQGFVRKFDPEQHGYYNGDCLPSLKTGRSSGN